MAKQQLLNQESPVSKVLNRYKKELTKSIERQITVPDFSLISEESKQETSISQIIRTYGNILSRLESDIPTDLAEDVLWVSSCLIMGGMANVSLMLKEDDMLH